MPPSHVHEQSRASKREAKRIRARGHQVLRGIAAVELATDALPLHDRLLVLNQALRNVLDDLAEIERRKAL